MNQTTPDLVAIYRRLLFVLVLSIALTACSFPLFDKQVRPYAIALGDLDGDLDAFVRNGGNSSNSIANWKAMIPD